MRPYTRSCNTTEMDGVALLPAPHNFLLSDAYLLQVTVTRVPQLLLDVVSCCARFYFSGTNCVRF